jgi:hypothetical protein
MPTTQKSINPKFDPRTLPLYPPMDESGNVDLSHIEYNLSLTPAQRWRQHARALELVLALRAAGEKLHGRRRLIETAD